ncbi:restriction endonuclease subunit S [Gardnerella vaginalis]|uniref:restriction endonuclease subunit S n=1 Tax=Gardnerella vaginalis TaxID=2702 RepID=UPI0039F0636E
MKFDVFSLGEIAKIRYGKNQKNVQSDNGDIPIYGTGGLMGYASRSLYNYPSVLIGRKGTIGKVSYVEHPFWTIDTLFYTEINENIVIPKFLYYLMSLIDLNAYDEGTTIPSLRTETLNRLELRIPSIDYQKKILNILNPIYMKIQANSVINKNLEEQAKAIYQNMFIDNPDNDWNEGSLSDIANITMGQSPSGSSYNDDGIGTVFFQGRAEFGFRFPTIRLYTTNPKRMASANDILMSVRAPVGDLNIAHEDCCIGRGLAAICSKTSYQSFILYTMFSLKKQLNVFNGEGTVFGSINRNSLNDMPILIPSDEQIEKFELIVAPMDAAIRNNYDEICRLQIVRDSLLTRLMSGELDVSNLDI